MAKKETRLKVAEAIQDDVNKGIFRIDSNLMREMDVRPGDIIEIEGDRTTVGIADRAYPGDIGLTIIRIDGIARRNAKTSIGEMIAVRKAEFKEAKKVVIAPARKGIVIRASANIFKQGLLGRAVLKGDIVSLGGSRRRRRTMQESPFFDDVFNILDESMLGFGFGDIKFVVADSSPKGAVVISDQTEVVFNPEAIEIDEETTLEVTYEDIGGLKEEIKKVREMVELPLKHPEIFERLGIEAPKGVLLHGPPGTGKTLLAKAVANETNSHFLLINGPEIMSKFYGQSEENLRKKFEDAEKNAPAIVFIDEIDAIATKREETHGEVERRVVAQLLALMDGLKSRGKVVVIAASNIPDSLDPALRRPGRFDREIEIGVPDKDGREMILKIHTRNMPLEGSWYNDVAGKTLIEKVDMKHKWLDEEIPKIKEKITDIEKSKKELDEEITKLKEMQKGREESVVGQILNKISRAQLKLKELEKEKKSTNEKLKNLQLDTKKLRETQELLNKRKGIILDIVKQAKSLEDLKELWEKNADEARLHFVKIAEKKTEKELVEVISELIALNVIDKSFYEKVRQKGIPRDLKNRARITHGFVGADLSALAKEAAMLVLRRELTNLNLKEEEPIPKEVLERLKVTQQDFKSALKVVRPSAMREVLVETPNVKWKDVGGLEEVKQELKEAVEWPLKNPEAFTRLGVKPPKGILIYGGPGTGKTMLAKAVANESEANFILVKGPELLSKWVGESEKAVREIFKKARQTAPTIIFFDEIDSLAPRRGLAGDSQVTERVVNQILTELDGLEELQDVVVLAATNRPDMLDTALLRPGRFDRIILAPIPDEKARVEIFKVHTKGMPLKGVKLEDLAKKTNGYVGADIEAVCREAAILALRKDIKAKEISMTNFTQALKKVGPSVTKEIEKSYEDMKQQFSQARAKEMEDEKPAYMG